MCRRSFSGLLLLAGALLLAGRGEVSAQRPSAPTPGQHEPLTGSLTPEQIKDALERFGRGGMPDLPPELLNLFRDRLEQKQKQPIDERQLKQALEMMQANPDLRRQFEEMGRKLKQNGGKGAITPEERQQLEKLLPDLQRAIPNPGQPPIGPMPPVPKNLNPPDPGKLDPPPVPDPMAPVPNPMMPPPGADPFRKLDPLGKDAPRDKAAQVAASLWERNIGPLDDTPAVKRALFELVEGTEGMRDADGKSFWDDLSLETGDSTSLSELLDDASVADSWTLPKFELPKLNWFDGDSGPDAGGGNSGGKEGWWSRNFGRPRTSTPSAPSAPSSSGWNLNLGVPALQGGWLPVVILLALLVGGLLVWRFWGTTWSRNRARGMLFGPDWPIDPRHILTREDVVVAFEYLSVLICGPTAKTWTHNTIGAALADLATTHGETAMMLARLYELARYAPLDEPLTTAELAEARRLICGLAGVEHE